MPRRGTCVTAYQAPTHINVEYSEYLPHLTVASIIGKPTLKNRLNDIIIPSCQTICQQGPPVVSGREPMQKRCVKLRRVGAGGSWYTRHARVAIFARDDYVNRIAGTRRDVQGQTTTRVEWGPRSKLGVGDNLTCSAMPAQTTFADAPIKVPLPPRQVPKARAQTIGRRGRPTVSSLAMAWMTGICGKNW